MASLEVIIVGGGLAGSCLANGLVNKSDGLVRVTVFEREEAGLERGGYQIRLGSHALTGFKACLTDEQYSSLLPLFGADKKYLIRRKLQEAGFHSSFNTMADALDDDALVTTPWRFAKDNTTTDWRQNLLTNHTRDAKSDSAIAIPHVWLMGDSNHPMLPSRGMGANNAIHDTTDALGPLLKLARLQRDRGSLSVDDVNAQLLEYESVMIPRAFAWVKKSQNQQLPGLESFKGRMLVLGLQSALFAAGAFMELLRFFGWEPKDDASDLA